MNDDDDDDDDDNDDDDLCVIGERVRALRRTQ